MATIGTLAVNVVANTGSLSAGMAKARTIVAGLQRSVFNLRNALLAIGSAGAARVFLDAAANAETLQTRLATLTGSAQVAATKFAELKRFAASTPFQLDDLASATNRLLAFGVSADEVMGVISMLGDVAAGTGYNINEFAAIFGKMKSSGVVALGDLNQLGDRAVPIFEALKRQLGLTGDELRKFVSSGALRFEDVVQALRSMTQEGGLFYQAMLKLSNTISGKISTLKDNFAALAVAIGEKLLPIASRAVEVLTKITQRVTALVPEVDSAQMKLYVFVGAFVAVIAIIPRLVAAFRAIVTALKAVASAQTLALALSGPKGWLAIGAGLAVAAAAGLAVEHQFSAISAEMKKTQAEANKVAAASKNAGSSSAKAAKDAAKLRAEAAAAEESVRKLKDAGAALTQELRTPVEVFTDDVRQFHAMLQAGAITWDTYKRAIDRATDTLKQHQRQASRPIRTQGVAAVTRGTSSAFSAVQGAARMQRDMERNVKQQLEEQRRTNALLEDILGKDAVKLTVADI